MVHHSMQGCLAIREGRSKRIMETAADSRELYDLHSDPGRMSDLVADPPALVGNRKETLTSIVLRGRAPAQEIRFPTTRLFGEI